MAQDAPPNGGDLPPVVQAGPWGKVARMQAKLHRWAAADPGRRFDDLFNLVYDPATLLVAFDRVAGNKGAHAAGVDSVTVSSIEESVGVAVFLDGLHASVKDGSFRPLPVRERKIPKPGGSGKVRALGIPTVADRVVQAALKLVLEPIFEADFVPVSYGFRPARRAHDAIAEIQMFGTKGYRWVLDADIEACFDSIEHGPLMDLLRKRISDRRVLRLVKSFLKSGILTETGENRETISGTPQGGILSPLLANIALSVLDEHLHGTWGPGGIQSTARRRNLRHRRGQPTWRLVRYADDFVVLVHGQETDVHALHREIADVLAPLGLRLSQPKTRIAHMSEGFDFLGFHIQWKRKRGTNKWYVYTFIADRPVKQLKAKIRALTRRTSQQHFPYVLYRLGQIMRGWAMYFRHAVAKHVFAKLAAFTWRRLVGMLLERHHWNWGAIRQRYTLPDGRWKPLRIEGREYVDIAKVPVTRYRYRGYIPNPWEAKEITAA